MDKNYEAEIYFVHTKDYYYTYDVQHEKMHEYRRVRSKDKHEAEKKAQTLADKWNAKWLRKCNADAKKEEKEQCLQKAADETNEAQSTIFEVENILNVAIGKDHSIDWENIKRKDVFSEKEPKKPELESIPSEPLQTWNIYKPKFDFIDKLITSKRLKKEEKLKKLFSKHHKLWEETCRDIEQNNAYLIKVYEQNFSTWEGKKNNFYEEQRKFNQKVKDIETDYKEGNVKGIKKYCNFVLARSEYPDSFPKKFNIDYNPETKMLVIDYQLPSPGDISTLKEIKYTLSKNEFREYHLSRSDHTKLYDKAVYQVCLRTIYEIFDSDMIDAISSVAFNGIVCSIDSSTGKEISPCILSLHTTKKSFLQFNLSLVRPKDCFKKLKGVGSSSFYKLVPIAPIINLNKNDKRFIASYDVIDKIDDSLNIAAMDWQDFEHLIRQLFEKEFASNGGEVKVTRGSRDGGVDAVAFDPDPIRGGKIIIQAKRYINTVEVSAVRDLYGTVVNEGAMKGILISTSDYGPDAYEFAKDKPLTLMNGSNLLYLLERHGTKAKIDINEARKILDQNRKG